MDRETTITDHDLRYDNDTIIIVRENIIKVFNRYNGVFTKCFHWICWSKWQKYFSLKWLKSASSCVRNQGAIHSTSKTHMRDRIFKFSPIHASVIYQNTWICWNCWIQWKFCSIQKNSSIGWVLIVAWLRKFKACVHPREILLDDRSKACKRKVQQHFQKILCTTV